MRATGLGILRKILAVAAIVEIGTGLALVVVPAIGIALLLGVNASAEGIWLARLLGVALFALGLACWPSRQRAEYGSSAFRGMFIYNLLVASYLACLGTIGGLEGLLLWPAVVLHGFVAAAMGWTWCTGRKMTATGD